MSAGFRVGLADEADDSFSEIANEVFWIEFRNVKPGGIKIPFINGIGCLFIGIAKQLTHSHMRLEEFSGTGKQRLASERGAGNQANKRIVGAFFCVQYLAGAPEIGIHAFVHTVETDQELIEIAELTAVALLEFIQ